MEGWAWYLRAEALAADPSLLKAPKPAAAEGIEEDEADDGAESMPAEACLSESMRALLECAQLFAEQDYPDEGIGAHVKELLEVLEKKGVQPAVVDENEENGAGDEGWEDVEEVEDVEMA